MTENKKIWRWSEHLEQTGKWDKLPHFKEGERIPRLKEFIMKLYMEDRFSTKDLTTEIYDMYRQLDQIWRNECEKFGEFNPTLQKDLDYFLGNYASIYSTMWFKPGVSEQDRERILLRAINEIAEGLIKNNKQSIQAKIRKEEVKKEDKILEKIKFPCKIKMAGKVISIKNKEEFDKKINYWGNHKLHRLEMDEKLKMPTLVRDFEGIIEK